MLIGQLCKVLGVSKHTIRHYESLGLIYSEPKAAGSREYKDYRADTLDRMALIEEAKALGLGLKEIKPLLDLFMDNKFSDEQSKQLVRDRLVIVNKQIAALQEIKARLQTKLAAYEP